MNNEARIFVCTANNKDVDQVDFLEDLDMIRIKEEITKDPDYLKIMEIIKKGINLNPWKSPTQQISG